jgi:hypothetical protein
MNSLSSGFPELNESTHLLLWFIEIEYCIDHLSVTPH